MKAGRRCGQLKQLNVHSGCSRTLWTDLNFVYVVHQSNCSFTFSTLTWFQRFGKTSILGFVQFFATTHLLQKMMLTCFKSGQHGFKNNQLASKGKFVAYTVTNFYRSTISFKNFPWWIVACVVEDNVTDAENLPLLPHLGHEGINIRPGTCVLRIQFLHVGQRICWIRVTADLRIQWNNIPKFSHLERLEFPDTDLEFSK